MPNKARLGGQIDAELYEAVRKLAFEERRSINSIIEEAVRAYLGRNEEGERLAMRDEQHYRHMMASNAAASIGYALAACAVYTACHGGACEAGERGTPEWRAIALDLKARYGDCISAEEVLRMMDAHTARR